MTTNGAVDAVVVEQIVQILGVTINRSHSRNAVSAAVTQVSSTPLYVPARLRHPHGGGHRCRRRGLLRRR
jgi:hypothetical protein